MSEYTMTSKRSLRRTIFGLALILLATTGCTEWLAASHGAAFVAGWVSRGLIGSSGETTCYLNGEPVACGTIPEGMMP